MQVLHIWNGLMEFIIENGVGIKCVYCFKSL